MRTSALPVDFAWGAATAAYQIEGSVDADGRGASIWDTFSHTPGKTLRGDTGDVATDHYRLWRDDIAIMGDLGLTAYRFSLAWPRIQPTGRGPLERRGLDFYDRLIDALLAKGIDPYVTLYHWDLPQQLQDEGGWPARDTAARFADFAQTVGEAYGDRVRTMTTLNEPWCSAFLGYASGVHAPGHRSAAESLAAAHHLNLGHGLAVQALRATCAPSVQLSVTLNVHLVRPATADDRSAANRVDLVSNRVFLDPMLLGRYPEALYDLTSSFSDWAFVRQGDEDLIAAARAGGIDVLGVNYYCPTIVREARESFPSPPDSPWVGAEDVEFLPPPEPTTQMGWTIDATGMRDLLHRLARDYPETPLVVTENGAAFPDRIAADGRVHDDTRVQFFEDHVAAVEEASADGVDVRGYFAWSLLDNFEWSFGYERRFGLVHVDYDNQQRTLKDSGYWYRDHITAWRDARSR